MLNAIFRELARLHQQLTISTDEASAVGFTDSSIVTNLKHETLQLLTNAGFTDMKTVMSELDKATAEEIQACLDEVEAEMPNPFVWSPPTDPFCSCCDKRPDWWNRFSESTAGSLKQLRADRGYTFDRHKDPEDGPGEWRYRGEVVLCDDCEVDGEDWAGPEWENDPGYERHCLEIEVTR